MIHLFNIFKLCYNQNHTINLAMTKFEYKTIEIRSNTGLFSVSINQEQLDKLFNKQGSEGWELVSSTPLSNNGVTYRIYYTFKRPI